MLRIRIRDPVRAFLTPGSGIQDPEWVKKIWILIRDKQPGSYFRELRNKKILKFFAADPGWRNFIYGIRNGKNSDPG
jgi:hypothetical protein